MWIIQSIHEGPVILHDVGVMLTHGQTRDLDLIGRENAERSNDVRIAIKKNLIKVLRKDEYVAPGHMNQAVVAQFTEASQQTMQAAQQMQGIATAQADIIAQLQKQLADQLERNKSLELQLNQQGSQTQQVLDNTTKMLEEVRAFARNHPLEIRSLKATLENIKIEKQEVEKKLEELPSLGLSENEAKAQERILRLKEQKLQRNAESIGKSISESATDVEAELDAMDQMGI